MISGLGMCPICDERWSKKVINEPLQEGSSIKWKQQRENSHLHGGMCSRLKRMNEDGNNQAD
jgi:hypothetical protein